jgi:hypothetical protein
LTRLPEITSAVEHVPLYRSALRIGLWWVIGFLALFAFIGLGSEIGGHSTGDTAGAVLGLSTLTGLICLASLVLRREIRAQRALLDQAGLTQDSPAWRPLSFKRIRLVSICLAASCAVLALLIALSPAAPTTQPQAPTLPTSSSPVRGVNQ